MKDFGVTLHPIKKIQLWRAIKKEVFDKMDKDILTPQQADAILADIKEKILRISTPEEAKKFYLNLSQLYPQLGSITNKFRIEEAEALDHVLVLLLDEIMLKGEFELASGLMEEMQKTKDHNTLAQELEIKYPGEFKLCIQRFSQKFN